MITVLETLNKILEEMSIPYTFETWETSFELPHFIGSVNASDGGFENGETDYLFTLHGYARTNGELIVVSDKLRKRFGTGEIVNGCVIRYNGYVPVQNDTDGLKMAEITMTIKDWSDC